MSDVQAAAPSAASVAPSELSIPAHGTPAYAEWRNTGKLPEAKTSGRNEEAAASDAQEKTAESGDGSEHESRESAPDPEAGKSTQEHQRRIQRKPAAEERIAELIAENKRLKEESARKTDVKAEPSTAKADEPAAQVANELKAPEKPVKPKLDDFSTVEEFEKAVDKYETARDEYFEKLTDYKAELKQREADARRAEESANAKLRSDLEQARSRYGKETDSVIFPTADKFAAKEVPMIFKDVVDSSDIGVDLLYALGSKSEDLNALLGKMKSGNRLQMRAALKEIFLIESLTEQELGKAKTARPENTDAPDRDEGGKFVSKEKSAPETKVSNAPPPATEVSGRGSNPPDAAETAFKANDFSSFRDSRNRRDMEGRRGR